MYKTAWSCVRSDHRISGGNDLTKVIILLIIYNLILVQTRLKKVLFLPLTEKDVVVRRFIIAFYIFESMSHLYNIHCFYYTTSLPYLVFRK